MQEQAIDRLSIRLSSDMLLRLSRYTKDTGASSDSAAVQFILLSFLNQPDLYPNLNAEELCYPQDQRTSFSLSLPSLAQLEAAAQQRGISKAECLRLALYYTLYN